MKTGEQYIESIGKLKPEIYMFGDKISDIAGNPILRPSLNSVKATYDLASSSEHKDLMTATSNLVGSILDSRPDSHPGKKINRFTHIHYSADDLVKKVKMLRLLGQKTASCFQRCVGLDAINALFSTTFEIDANCNTSYHKNFLSFLKEVQENDLTLNGAMTDPKGDRSRAPSEQSDPDMFLRVVERRDDGIVVRGAKVHQTGITGSHEIIVMPTIALSPEEKDYAVSFAVPVDTNGIIIIIGRQSCDTRKMEIVSIEGSGECPSFDAGNCQYGGMEAMVVFDDVFVPNDRIFLNGETEYASMLVERFAAYHRQSYGGCKAGVGDVLIGASALIADYNGTAKASHIKDKIIEMIHLNETIYSCGVACSSQGWKTRSGNFMVDLLLANVCKQNVTRFPYEICRLAEDIAGGLLVTSPSEKDFRHEKLKPYIEKYLKGVDGVSTEDRLRLLRFMENLCLGSAAVAYRTESMHGAGSPQAQRIMIARQGNIDQKKALAKALSGIVK